MNTRGYIEHTQPKQSHTPKRDIPLVTAVGIALILGIVAIAPVIYSVHYIRTWHNFVERYTQSANYARQHSSAEAQNAAGRRWHLESLQTSQVYNLVIDIGMGKVTKEAPSEPAPITILYGDGTSISFWSAQSEDILQGEQEGLFIRYDGLDGYCYQYDTNLVSLEPILAYLGANSEN